MLFADDAALIAHTENALQRLITSFVEACSEFGLTISLKKTNIMGQDVSIIPAVTVGDHTLEVVENFTYLGSTISSNLSLDAELNTRIGKAATTMARLAKRVWDNNLLTLNTKIKGYQACVLSTLLYGSEAWTLYSRQEQRLNVFHLRCLRRLLGITWRDHVTNKSVLSQAEVPSMFATLTQRRLRWIGDVCRMVDGRIPKDVLYGELTTGKRPTGRPVLCFKDTCKHDLKACGINPANLEQVTSNRTQWHSTIKAGVQRAEEEREILHEEKRNRRQQKLQSVPTVPIVPVTPTTLITDYICSNYFSQQPEYKAEEVLTEQQLWIQERNSILDQEESEPTQQQSEAEPNSEQLLSHNSAGTEIQDEEGSRHVDSGSTEEEEPKPKKRRLETGSHSNSDDDCLTSETLCENETGAPQLHDCQEEEVLTVQQLCNQERKYSLDQEEQDAAQVKEEEHHFGLKQETDSFKVTFTDEDNDQSETEPNSELLLSHNSPDTESQDQGAGKNVNPGSSKHEEPKPKKRLHRNRSDRNNADNSFMSENQCDTDGWEKSVKCSDNDKDCKNESQKKKHHTVKSHVCNMCGKRFRNKNHLSCHKRTHTGEKPFSCETCGQRFNDRAKWKAHIRIHTGEKPFSCETCGQNFNRLAHLKIHMRIHTGEKPFSCETCGQRFNQHANLKTHLKIHTGEKPFSCETCGQRFIRLDRLKIHFRAHTGEKPFSCETCGQRFIRLDHLKTHMRIHIGEKPFSCETCGQRFNEGGALKTHLRIHTGEKPFSCETCGQRFNERGALKRHMRIHTGEKPFSCETCGKRFIERGALKRHMRIHTGEKPFSCETCGQRFNERGSLKTHLRIHTGEKPFSCETCGQRFNRLYRLKTHMRIHTGEKKLVAFSLRLASASPQVTVGGIPSL
ncbi:uncharacterized protein KZ484_010926 [Pholidichthys leucotaenia]